MDAIYTRARFDDLDLNARSQWVGKGKNQQRMLSLSATKQAISMKRARTVAHLYVTLPLQTFIWLDHLFFAVVIFNHYAFLSACIRVCACVCVCVCVCVC